MVLDPNNIVDRRVRLKFNLWRLRLNYAPVLTYVFSKAMSPSSRATIFSVSLSSTGFSSMFDMSGYHMVCVSQWAQNGCTVFRHVRLSGCIHFSQFAFGGAMVTNEVLCNGVCLCEESGSMRRWLTVWIDGMQNKSECFNS